LATGAVGVRMFPFDNLRVDGGVAWTRPLARGATTSGSPFAAFEWQLPLGSPDWQVSIFAERQLSTAELAGLRVAWNMGATLRDAARRAAWIRVR
jgi:hypothetical protein